LSFEELRTRVEVETLHELLPDLDYYRLLLLTPDATAEAINVAFRAQTRALHPDRFFALSEADLKVKCQEIFKRVNEAWRTLKDPALRTAYDRDRKKKGDVRMSTSRREEAERAKRSAQDVGEVARTAQGRKHWQLALHDFAAKNLKGAVLNAEIALKYEPDNRAIAKWVIKVRALAQAE
jgi:DnaJ homolog subfamily C member 11